MAARLHPPSPTPPFLQHCASPLLLHLKLPAEGVESGKLRSSSSCCRSLPWEAAAALSLQAVDTARSMPSLALLLGASKAGLEVMWANRTFSAGLLAWAVAQGLQTVALRWWAAMTMVMPSSHSALCSALTTSVALTHGLSHPLFPVCLGFALIAMYDSAGVRRHAGIQAQVLNSIVEYRFQGHPLRQKKLKELLGHTPLQVGAGAVLGIIVGYLCSQGCAAFPGRVL